MANKQPKAPKTAAPFEDGPIEAALSNSATPQLSAAPGADDQAAKPTEDQGQQAAAEAVNAVASSDDKALLADEQGEEADDDDDDDDAPGRFFPRTVATIGSGSIVSFSKRTTQRIIGFAEASVVPDLTFDQVLNLLLDEADTCDAAKRHRERYEKEAVRVDARQDAKYHSLKAANKRLKRTVQVLSEELAEKADMVREADAEVGELQALRRDEEGENLKRTLIDMAIAALPDVAGLFPGLLGLGAATAPAAAAAAAPESAVAPALAEATPEPATEAA